MANHNGALAPIYKVIARARNATPVHITPEDNTGSTRVYYQILDRYLRVTVKRRHVIEIESHTRESERYAQTWRRLRRGTELGERLIETTLNHLNKQEQ